ncbi:hypothetical protein [Moorena producens]|uniref:hypothetical protein n=1 Tax=Moorena producens TaxID=1155739 RepID=UPI000AB4F611|nr:hypothetical protein [Moorena producens]
MYHLPISPSPDHPITPSPHHPTPPTLPTLPTLPIPDSRFPIPRSAVPFAIPTTHE